jgi:hypothetical protein
MITVQSSSDLPKLSSVTIYWNATATTLNMSLRDKLFTLGDWKGLILVDYVSREPTAWFLPMWRDRPVKAGTIETVTVRCEWQSRGVAVEVILRPTVSRPVCLGVKFLSVDNAIFITVIQLLAWWGGKPSLMRGLIWRLQLALGLVRAVFLGSESRGNHRHILLSLIREPRTWGARSPYLYTPGTGWPSYALGTRFLYRRLLRFVGLRWRYSNPPPHGMVECLCVDICSHGDVLLALAYQWPVVQDAGT